MTRLTIRLLGPFSVGTDGKTVTGFATDKARALLAYLVVEADRPHRREHLAGLFWPDYPDPSARKSLSTALANVRDAIGDRDANPPFLEITRHTIQFNGDSDVWCDVGEFEKCVASLSDSSHRGERKALNGLPQNAPGIEALEKAVALYRGAFLEGFSLADCVAFEDWALVKREQLQRQMLETLYRLAAYQEQRGDYDQGLRFAWRQVEIDPWRESAQRQLMRLLTFSGQRGAALAQYEDLCRILADELSVQPAAETTALFERIRSAELRARVREAPILAPHNLPTQPTSFIGRQAALADLDDLIGDPTVRLITIVGAGGMGKTRLALQAAKRALAHFPDGAWFVQLASLDDDDAVPQAIASALRVPNQPGQSLQETVVDSLRLRQLLLIMDNCEHVRDGTATMVGLALEQCPRVTILATSREVLRIPGEHLYPVLPLTLPAAETTLQELEKTEAGRLFLERSRAVRPGFEFTEINAVPVNRICRRLDGMPLAIELAAARMRAFSPGEIASRLDDRFAVLTGGSYTSAERQQTLLNTVMWSYDLLTEAEQMLFDRVSVFRGGFTVRAAEKVCAGPGLPARDVFRLLARLVDKCMVQREETDAGDSRYRLLESLRQYGGERLVERGQREAIRERHAVFYVALAEKTEPELLTPKQTTWWQRLYAEEGNVRAAVQWLLANGRHEMALRLVAASFFWWGGGHLSSPGLQWLLRGLAEATDLEPQVRAKALTGAGFLYWRDIRDQERAQALLEESLALFRQVADDKQVSNTLYDLGLVAQAQGENPRARQLFLESLALGRDSGNEYVEAAVLPSLALLEAPHRAEELLDQAVALSQKLQWPWMMGWAYLHKGFIAEAQGELKRAKSFFERALAHYREIDSPIDMSGAGASLVELAMLLGEYGQARALVEEVVAWSRRLGLPARIAWAMQAQGRLAWHEGDMKTAQACMAESLEVARGHVKDWVLLIEGLLSWATVARDQGNYVEARALCQEGLALAEEHDSQFWQGEAFTGLGSIAHRSGDGARALALHRRALRRLGDDVRPIQMAGLLEELAWALVAVLSYELAARLLAHNARWREHCGLVLARPLQPHHDRALAAVRQALREKLFGQLWAQGEALTREEAIDLALTAESA